MEKMIAYCGLICTNCPAYIATQKNDLEALEKLASRWQEELNTSLTAEGCMCDGCLATTDRRIEYCSECKVRACAIEKEVENCAHCGEYVCRELEKWFGTVPEAKITLDRIRKNL